MSYYYVYVLRSLKDGQMYTGYTADLKNRLKLHQTAQVASTKNRLPVKLIYFEGCLNQQDATRREKYLKSGNRQDLSSKSVTELQCGESNGLNVGHV